MIRQLRAFCPLLTQQELPWLQRQLATAAGRGGGSSQQAEPEPQPLSQVVLQLEAVVTDPRLPPDVLAANTAAFGKLRAFLDRLTGLRTYPKAEIQNLQFALRQGQKLQRVRCQLKTTGGDCSRLVATSLGELLARAGLNPFIYFDRDEFQPNTESEPTPQEVADVRAKAAAAGVPSQTITEEEFRELEEKQQVQREGKTQQLDEADEWAKKLKQVDPLFAALAAVPWMLVDEDGGERRQYVQTRVLDELEAMGWDIRGPAHRVWRGEREVRALAAGKDAGSQAAIQSLVYHAHKFDEEYGRKTLSDVTPQ